MLYTALEVTDDHPQNRQKDRSCRKKFPVILESPTLPATWTCTCELSRKSPPTPGNSIDIPTLLITPQVRILAPSGVKVKFESPRTHVWILALLCFIGSLGSRGTARAYCSHVNILPVSVVSMPSLALLPCPPSQNTENAACKLSRCLSTNRKLLKRVSSSRHDPHEHSGANSNNAHANLCYLPRPSPVNPDP